MGIIHLNLRDIHSVGKGTKEWIVGPGECPLLKNVNIYLAGFSNASSRFRFVRNQPEYQQILVCFRGQGRVWTSQGWKKCGPGQAYVTFPGIPHAYEATRQWEVGWIMTSARKTSGRNEPRLLEIDPRPLELVLRGLQMALASNREPSALVSWVELLDVYGSQAARLGSASRLWLLWEEVKRKPGAPWNLTILAKRAGVGSEQLRRICVEENGQSPMRRVALLRMKEALSMLGMGYSVQATAREVGYENSFAFSTAFRRIVGSSPSKIAAGLRR